MKPLHEAMEDLSAACDTFKAHVLEALDAASHRLLDPYINAQLPGWGRLQLWQYRLCCAMCNTWDDVEAER